jgi:endonuclease-3 related protein
VSPEKTLRALYALLLKEYGAQGWWPLTWNAAAFRLDGIGYHPGDFSLPRTPAQRFEIIMGAVLTQNTAWTNVTTALRALYKGGVRTPKDLEVVPMTRLAALVKPSGYFNQKARKLKALLPVVIGRGVLSAKKAPSRKDLLSVWGIGEETADSILLYAFKQPVFVVDAYTRRLLLRLGLIGGREKYGGIQALFHAAIPADHEIYNEYHALIVEHAKRHCRARPACPGCPLHFCPSGSALEKPAPIPHH